MNARYYNPAIGSFTSQDTYYGEAYSPWTQHLYSYTGGNPVNYIDPTGHRNEQSAGLSMTWGGPMGGNSYGSGVEGMGVSGGYGLNIVDGVGIAIAYAIVALSYTSARDEQISSRHISYSSPSADEPSAAAVSGSGSTGGYGGDDGDGPSEQDPIEPDPEFEFKDDGIFNQNYDSAGSTGRATPENLLEQIAWKMVRYFPPSLIGAERMYNYGIELGDPRWSATADWMKMQVVFVTSRGNIVLHYVYNDILNLIDDIKFITNPF